MSTLGQKIHVPQTRDKPRLQVIDRHNGEVNQKSVTNKTVTIKSATRKSVTKKSENRKSETSKQAYKMSFQKSKFFYEL